MVEHDSFVEIGRVTNELILSVNNSVEASFLLQFKQPHLFVESYYLGAITEQFVLLGLFLFTLGLWFLLVYWKLPLIFLWHLACFMTLEYFSEEKLPSVWVFAIYLVRHD